MLDQASQRLAAAEAARVPRRALMAPRAAIAAASASLQKAGTEIHDGYYQESQSRLSDSATSLRPLLWRSMPVARRPGRQTSRPSQE
jgi:hypothetical protein